MWLLRIADDGTFSLVDCVGSDSIPYSILSHTWGKDHEEVTFKDLQTGLGAGKAGYRKIQFCADQTLKDGLRHFWVDTCCIDKTSSAELSEAINSMFRWYQNSEKCYVYLSDVSFVASGDEKQGLRAWESDFRKSRWFTRGWTLQELIAPKRVEFFSVEGHRLDDRLALENTLQKITGIQSEILRGKKSLSQVTVEERFAWSKQRQTKREEDEAYSLLGIFNVHMTLIYGEGRQKAFRRLRKEIAEEEAYAQQESIPPTVSLTHKAHGHDSSISGGKVCNVPDQVDVSKLLAACAEALNHLSLDDGSNLDAHDGTLSKLGSDEIRPLEWGDNSEKLDERTPGDHESESMDEDLRSPRKNVEVRKRRKSQAGTKHKPAVMPSDSNDGALEGRGNNEKTTMPTLGSKKHSHRPDLSVADQVKSFCAMINNLFDVASASNYHSHIFQQIAELKDCLKSMVLTSTSNLTLMDSQGELVQDWARIERLTLSIHQNAKQETQKTVNDWLDVAHMETKHQFAQFYDKQVSLRLDGTCGWIHTHPAYSSWSSDNGLDSCPKILWISAPAGTGKTVLCARLVEHLKEHDSSPVACFFASPHAQTGGEPNFIIRSWVSQITALDPGALAIVRRASEPGQRASESAVWDVFKAIVSHCPPCTFTLDGFDEYSPEGNIRAKFLRKLKETIGKTSSRILITCRNETDIEGELAIPNGDSDYVVLHCKITAEDVRHDISLFSKRIVDDKLPTKGMSLRNDLAGQLADKCEGMFLWIKLQQDQLRGGKSDDQLQDTVKDMPAGLIKTYERNWTAIQEQGSSDRKRALAILRWTTFASRPLNVSEISEALIIATHDQSGATLQWRDLPHAITDEYITTEIIQICRDLVEVRTSGGNDELAARTLHLIHPSVREFMLVALSCDILGVYQPTLRIVQDDGQRKQHQYLAIICLEFLNSEEVWNEEVSTKQQNYGKEFLNYAARHWPDHVKAAGKDDVILFRLMKQFFRGENKGFLVWRNLIETAEPADPEAQFTNEGTVLYYAASLDLVAVMEHIWGKDRTLLNKVGGKLGTPLQAASSKGYEVAFQELLDWGADPNVVGGEFGVAINAAIVGGHKNLVEALIRKGADLTLRDSMERTPLYTAAMYNQLEAVEWLIKAGADMNAQNKYGFTGLNVAASRGHLDIMRLLINNHADSTIRNRHGRTPLHSSSSNGHVDGVKLLLQSGVEPEILPVNTTTPLYAASANGHLEITDLLLGAGVPIEIATASGWTPLHVASSNGHVSVVKLLLERGANISSLIRNGSTPLYLASGKGRTEVVKFLIEKGAKMSPNNEGWTPLKTASLGGHFETCKILLDAGEDVAWASSNNGATALYSAANKGHHSVAKLLLERAPGLVNIQNQDGWSPLNAAAFSGHISTVELLLQNGASVKNRNKNGSTPLYSAASKGFPEVVRKILAAKDGPETINIVDKENWTPLNSASLNGRYDVVKVLLEWNADFTIINVHGATPLYSAARKGYLEIVQALVDLGADVLTQTNKEEWRPLLIAANYGHTEVVRLLLKHGANIEHRNRVGWTSLNAASCNGHLDTVKVLLENDADPSVPNNFASTAIYSATNKGHYEIAKLLLDRGANIETPNQNGWTCLNIASLNGYVNLVRLLLENGADIKTTNKFKSGPLYSSARNGHVEVAKLLLEKGAEMDVTNVDGWTPLGISASNGHHEFVQLMIDHGSKGVLKTKSGWTPLYAACCNGHLKAAEVLINNGAYVEASISNGSTPLYIAADKGFPDIVRMLIERGASLSTRNNQGWTPLTRAAQNGSFEVVEVLIAQGAEIQSPNYDYHTALHAAVQYEREKVVKLLLEKGADAEPGLTYDGWSPLNLAVQNSRCDIAEMLLAKGAVTAPKPQIRKDIEEAAMKFGVDPFKAKKGYSNGGTFNANSRKPPLVLAASKGDHQMVQVLLAHNAPISLADVHGYTALNLASQKGHVRVVKMLLEKETSTIEVADNDIGWTPLGHAAHKGYVEVVKVLMEHGANLAASNKQGLTALHGASRDGHTDVVKLLLHQAGFKDVSDTKDDSMKHESSVADFTKLLGDEAERKAESTPLQLAVKSSHAATAGLLIAAGADVKEISSFKGEPQSLLHAAILLNDELVVARLLDKLPHLATAHDTTGCTPPYNTARDGQLKLLQIILEKVPHSISVTDTKGWTPLHVAASKNHADIVAYLLAQGADMEIAAQNKATPLYTAAHCGHTDVVKLLLDNGASPSAVTTAGWTPLNTAASRGHIAIVKALLDSSTEALNTGTKHGWTPLYSAVAGGNIETVRLLLERGADAAVVVKGGKTPMEAAEAKGFADIIQLLEGERDKALVSACETAFPQPPRVPRTAVE